MTTKKTVKAAAPAKNTRTIKSKKLATTMPALAAKAADSAQEVVFMYSPETQNPRNVFVAGDFNEWNPQRHALQLFDGGVYRAVLHLAPGTYQYKFVVDGEWTHDPRAEFHTDNEHGTLNSVVRV